LAKNQVLGTLVALTFFFTILAPNQVLVVERLLGKRNPLKIVKKSLKKNVNFSSFWQKKSRDLGGIYVCFTFFYDFGTVPYENRKKNVNKS